MQSLPIRGRGTGHNPPNRFERLSYEPEPVEPGEAEAAARETQYFRDHARSILTRNSSPDVPFEVSLNVYRGCSHGCSYCYARPYHEYLGLSAGLDFESRIFVKEDAPALLRAALASPRWRPQVISMSGATDPYQPAERRFRLTRGCLEVLAEFRNPVAIVTKNHLVTRDADLLGELAGHGAAGVVLSDHLARRGAAAGDGAAHLDPGAAAGGAGGARGGGGAGGGDGGAGHPRPHRPRAARHPGGGRRRGRDHRRLRPAAAPRAVAELFDRWLEHHFPERKEKVLHRLREIRGGKLNEKRFGLRMRGEGEYAEQLRALFHVTCRRLGLNRRAPWSSPPPPSAAPSPATSWASSSRTPGSPFHSALPPRGVPASLPGPLRGTGNREGARASTRCPGPAASSGSAGPHPAA